MISVGMWWEVQEQSMRALTEMGRLWRRCGHTLFSGLITMKGELKRAHNRDTPPQLRARVQQLTRVHQDDPL